MMEIFSSGKCLFLSISQFWKTQSDTFLLVGMLSGTKIQHQKEHSINHQVRS